MRALSKLLFFSGLVNVFMGISLVTIFWDEIFNLNTEGYPYQTIGVLIIAPTMIFMGSFVMFSLVIKYEKWHKTNLTDNTEREKVKKIKEDFESRTTTPQRPSNAQRHDLH